LLVPAWSIVVVLLTYFTYFSMTIRSTPAFSDSSTYTGRLVSILLQCLPFLAKVSTLQIQEGNTQTPVVRIPTLRTPDRMQYRRRMIYRLAWSIVCFMTTTAPQENRPPYIGNYLCMRGIPMFPNCIRPRAAGLHVFSDPQMWHRLAHTNIVFLFTHS
jgi:hypothetical protein